MIQAEIRELQCGAAECNRPIIIYCLVGNYRMRILEPFKTLFGFLVRDERGAGVLEGLTAGYMIEMMMAVNHVPDRLIRDLLDLVQVSGHRLGPSVADRIGRDHALLGDDKHCLRAAVTKNINILGAVYFSGRKRRLLLGLGRSVQNRYRQCCAYHDIK